MSEFFFVMKTALFSALVLMVLQMKIGGTTLERHSETWIYHSRVGGEMQAVARGAVKAGHEGFDWIRGQTSSRTQEKNNRERSEQSRSQSDDVD